jgi:diguanylate cyclase (GGDEF)-like protein
VNPEVPNPNRVLVIDDSEDIHRLVRHQLKPDRREVSVELDPQRGIERAIAERPDLILLDIGLPGIDGFEVCRRLKGHRDTHNIPIIFLTGAADVASKERGLDLGAVDFVTKPPDEVELRARVRSHLREKRLRDMLEQQSRIDALTGLWNRAHLDQQLESFVDVARRYGRPLSLVLADIDHFKDVNDAHGHLFGDLVLQGIADGMRGYARRSDIVARYGGEEFAILLTDTGSRAAVSAAERLRQSAEAHAFQARSTRVSVTVSLGVVCSDEVAAPLTPAGMMDLADQALYASKDAGRNCVHLNSRGRLVRVRGDDAP